VGAEIVEFLPLEVIVQIAQDLGTILITWAHSGSFPPSWLWRSVKAVATDKNTSNKKIFPEPGSTAKSLFWPALFIRMTEDAD
jgi:hypothetical protein